MRRPGRIRGGLCLAAAGLVAAYGGGAADAGSGPHPPPAAGPGAAGFGPAPELGAGGAEAVVLFFERVVSRVDGDRCRHAPTCSAYGRRALARHGLAGGVLRIADRLLRDATFPDRDRPLVMIDGRPRVHDPLPGPPPDRP